MLEAISKIRSSYNDLKRELNFLDTNVWLGRSMTKIPYCMQTGEELLLEMEQHLIAESLVSHVLGRFSKPETGNQLTIDAISKSSRLIGAFILLPDITGEMGNTEKYVLRMLASGMRAARIFPRQHGFSVLTKAADKMFRILQERSIPLHIWSREIPWESLGGIAAKYPNLPVIVEQCEEETFRNIRKQFPVMEENSNLFLEVHHSHLYLILDAMVKKFGAGRFVYSSYYPTDDPEASLMLVTHGNFSKKNKRLIAGDNYRRLLSGIKI